MSKILHITYKLKTYKWHFIFQMLFAVLFLSALLFTFEHLKENIVLGAIGISSICSSTFIVFAIPDAPVAIPHRILGGYITGTILGVCCRLFLVPLLTIHTGNHAAITGAHELAGAIAVTLSMFFMVLFDLHHPPAAGFSLGLVLAPWDNGIILLVGISALILATIVKTCKRWLVSFL